MNLSSSMGSSIDKLILPPIIVRKGAGACTLPRTLSRVINSLESSEDYQDNELEKFNMREAFDYTVNEYYLPAMSGDIFTNSHGEWFVLIGQDRI